MRNRRIPVVPVFLLCFTVLVGYRVWRSHGEFTAAPPEIPEWTSDATQLSELHLQPAGRYTWADIEANGRTTPTEKYRLFQARHDVRTQPGDILCPITRTKANPACTWIVAGKEYQFCCPPCIDEFVRLAKEEPAKIQAPADYVQGR